MDRTPCVVNGCADAPKLCAVTVPMLLMPMLLSVAVVLPGEGAPAAGTLLFT